MLASKSLRVLLIEAGAGLDLLRFEIERVSYNKSRVELVGSGFITLELGEDAAIAWCHGFAAGAALANGVDFGLFSEPGADA
jgi:hypothetical protein